MSGAAPPVFDRVLTLVGGVWTPMPMERFFELPLSVRIRHVIERTVAFQLSGKEVDAKEALAAMRQLRAAREGAKGSKPPRR